MKFILALSFLGTQVLTAQQLIRYVALGDSYTICTGAEENQSWPRLISEKLNQNNINIQLVENPAHNGWTTLDLIKKELPVFNQSNAAFVTLLIGVNDWVQGVSADDFRINLSQIITYIQARLPDKNNLVLITIPDFGVTPTGKQYGNGRDISQGIFSFNKIILEEAKKRKLNSVDLFEISKQMGEDASLIAADGLHPSAKEYAIWAVAIYPKVLELFEKK